MQAQTLLPMMLEQAVNLAILDLQQLDARQFAAMRDYWLESAAPGDLPGAFSEAVLYRIPGKTAPAFAHLARAIAALAFQPGGVQFAGLHFHATHYNSQENAA